MAMAGNPPKTRWIMPSSVVDRCGGPIGYHEVICGTEKYCEIFDNPVTFKGNPRHMPSKAQCLAGRDPPPTVPSTSVPLNVYLLPWREPKSPRSFSFLEDSFCTGNEVEADCGTALYCGAFDTHWISYTRKEYASSGECLAAHAPEPADRPARKLPYALEPKNIFYSKFNCGNAEFSDFYCGTKRFCLSFDRERAYAKGYYSNSTECFDAHEPPPPGGDDASPLRAWVVGEGEPCELPNKDMMLFATEGLAKCGTKWLCEQYGTPTNRPDTRYGSAAECLAAFERQPDDGGYCFDLRHWRGGRDADHHCSGCKCE
ncbi:hypothetical protein L249_6671 [Ophiocordyceps polyrhachis-furcata BCC 54312]|uniref:Uncharacterized protein n=1 Tax=Ophiocordyceps polyrhachis-furcata BCC 54312 TaxID=1330021 RepID=A0A367LKS9_9HYPO|nr:hypothetical protein L249_6671 [Ophiocordyceps polyrhachis-furcata BCC 54312]